MELSLQQRRKALLGKIPDMENTLRVVEFLHRRRQKKLGTLKADEADEDEDDLEAEDGEGADDDNDNDKLTSLFELNDTLYAEAQIEETGEVGIWLGVRVVFFKRFRVSIQPPCPAASDTAADASGKHNAPLPA